MEEKNFKSILKNIVRDYTIVIVIIVLGAIFTLGNRSFLSINNFLTILRQSAIMGTVGVGLMFCMVTGAINLSMGSYVSATTVLIAVWVTQYGMNWIVASILCLALNTLIGFVQGLVTVKGELNAMIASLAVQTILAGAAYLISGGLPVYGLPEEAKILGQGNIGIIPVPVIVLLVAAAIVSVIFTKTYFGRKFFATGSNLEAARLSGIKTDKIRIVAFVICGFFGGLAGILMLGRLGSGQPAAGAQIDMNIIAALIIGGVAIGGGEGKVFRALCGVILINMLINGMTLMNINPYWQQVARGAVFLFAIILDSWQHRPPVKKRAPSNKKAEEKA